MPKNTPQLSNSSIAIVNASSLINRDQIVDPNTLKYLEEQSPTKQLYLMMDFDFDYLYQNKNAGELCLEKIKIQLEAYGFQVLGVITRYDTILGQNLGDFYQHTILTLDESSNLNEYSETLEKITTESEAKYNDELNQLEPEQNDNELDLPDFLIANKANLSNPHFYIKIFDKLSELHRSDDPSQKTSIFLFTKKQDEIRTFELINIAYQYRFNLKSIQLETIAVHNVEITHPENLNDTLLIQFDNYFFRYRIFKKPDENADIFAHVQSYFNKLILQARGLNTPNTHPREFLAMTNDGTAADLRGLEELTHFFGSSDLEQMHETLKACGITEDDPRRRNYILRLLMQGHNDADVEMILRGQGKNIKKPKVINGGLLFSMQAVFSAFYLELIGGELSTFPKSTCVLDIKHDNAKSITCITFRLDFGPVSALAVFNVLQDYHIEMTDCFMSIDMAKIASVKAVNHVCNSLPQLKCVSPKDHFYSISREGISRLFNTIYNFEKHGNIFSRNREKAIVGCVSIMVGVGIGVTIFFTGGLATVPIVAGFFTHLGLTVGGTAVVAAGTTITGVTAGSATQVGKKIVGAIKQDESVQNAKQQLQQPPMALARKIENQVYLLNEEEADQLLTYLQEEFSENLPQVKIEYEESDEEILGDNFAPGNQDNSIIDEDDARLEAGYDSDDNSSSSAYSSVGFFSGKNRCASNNNPVLLALNNDLEQGITHCDVKSQLAKVLRK